MVGDNLKGVIVGAGFFAGFQGEAWSRSRKAHIAAVVDPQLEKAREFADKYGISQVYPTLEEAISQQRPDFVDIVTRPETHLDLVKLAAESGCQVICQKPMAPTLAECEEMVSCCEQAGVRLLIHENWRWQPWYREIHRVVHSQSLGRVFQLSFQVRTGDGWGENAYTVQPYFREMKRMLVYETLVHHIDTARFLAGEVATVACLTQRINERIVGEDSATVLLGLKSGGQATIDANRINGPVPAPVVFGTVLMEAERGAVRLDGDARLWLTQYGEHEVKHAYDWPDRGYRGDSVFATQEHLLSALMEGTPAESEGREYLKTVRIVEACYESADSGRSVSLE